MCSQSQANVGQDDDFDAAKEKAVKLGAIKVRSPDAKIINVDI